MTAPLRRHLRCARGRASLGLLAACGLALAAAPASVAQVAPPVAERVLSATGRDFAGVRLSTDTLDGGALFTAQRASIWRSGPARRISLEGDPTFRLGAREFLTDRCTVWIEQLDDAGALHQIAVYGRNVRDPGRAAAGRVTADRLLVTAVVRGPVELRTDVLTRAPAADPLVPEGEQRLARFLRETVFPPAPPTAIADGSRPAQPGEPVMPGAAPEIVGRNPVPPPDPALGPAERAPLRTPDEGVVSFFAPERTLVTGREENALTLSGGVVVAYEDPAQRRTLQLSAERAVVFLDPGSVSDILEAGPGQVRGVYLEGDVVASDGSYTLRGTRIYYDLATNRATVLEAVFWAYDQQRGSPLYVRADAIRQLSQDQWAGEGVRVANSAFFEPFLSLGAESVTITRERGVPAPGVAGGAAGDSFSLEATGGAIRVGGLPVVPLPKYEGDLGRPALRAISVGSRDGQPIVRTTWDLPTLLGQDAPDGFTADLLVDGYFSRGPAGGLDISWKEADVEGSAFGYIIYDNGTDDLTSGAEIGHEDDLRGIATLEHRWAINSEWTIFLEGAYISDPSFVDAFFPGLAETRREFINSIYARRTEGRSLLSLEARGTFTDFTPNEYLLQSQGYQVNKLPELLYGRAGDPLFGDAIYYSGETSVTRMSLALTEPQVSEFGFDTVERSEAAFGLLPNQSLADRLRAQGLNESWVNRFDTRHEVAAPLDAGPVRVEPFAVGRVTAYDEDFQAFSPQQDDKVRLWGGGGVRLGTAFTHIDDDAESRFFDVHRMRHIVEPGATVWYGASNFAAGDLPVYDSDVEPLATGTAFRAGLTSTWQTMRGGPGRWRSEDWLILRADYVWSSNDIDRTAPIGRWYDPRPELSNLGEFIDGEALWQVTDAASLIGRAVYDLDADELALIRGGLLLDHGRGFSTFVEASQIDALDSTFLDFGARWQLSRKYWIEGAVVYDLEREDVQSYGVTIERRFEQWAVQISIGHDNITDDTSIGVALRPVGFGAGRSGVYTPELVPAGLDRREPAPTGGIDLPGVD